MLYLVSSVLVEIDLLGEDHVRGFGVVDEGIILSTVNEGECGGRPFIERISSARHRMYE